MNKLLKVGALLAGVMLGGGQAWSESLEDLQIRDLDRTYYTLRSSGGVSDCLWLYYVGASSDAAVTITSTTLLSYAPSGTLDSNFGTSGGYDLSAAGFDTMVELCNTVDRLADYECQLMGCEGGLNTDRLRDQTAAGGTNNLKANRGFFVQLDTGPINGGGDGTFAWEYRVGRTPKKGRRISVKECRANVAGTNNVGLGPSLRIFGAPRWSEWDTRQTYDSTYEVFRASFMPHSVSTFTFTVEGIGGFDFAKNATVSVGAGFGRTAMTDTGKLECIFEEK